MSNYTPYHVHSDLSNGVTNVDSVTKYKQYIERANECGMTAFAFAEHGSVFEWWHKKCDIEAAGMKYIHAVEAYITFSLEEKVRDNYHCVLIARNYEGVLELNELISNSFNRSDNHFYYVPRISFGELCNTSANIMVTSACIGGPLAKAQGDQLNAFLGFFIDNKDRCYFEVGHHLDPRQITYNQALYRLSMQYKVPLIAGTDTHCLNETHVEGRKILQLSKNIRFDDEDNWDLTFKTYDELVDMYARQNALPKSIYLKAIDATNELADRVEPFTIDRNPKYPHIFDNPETVFRQKIDDAVKNHPYILKRHKPDEVKKVIDDEFQVYKKTGAIDFMLLQTYLREWERENGIFCGPGRGSVSGSMIAYALGITSMDSMKFKLNYYRFMNPERVSLADIDTDYAPKDRDRVKTFLLRDRLGLGNIQTAEIITFNTIAEKGAVRDVGRALQVPLPDVAVITKALDDGRRMDKEYPELFKYVDIVSGTIVSIGSHPSGVLVSDLPIRKMVGMCSTSGSEYQVSMLNMKELDDLSLVKLDLLGLDNLALINDTCKLAGIERLTPDNTDFNDMDVWRSIRENTTGIFQWESGSAQAYLRKFMSDKTLDVAQREIKNFSPLTWFSFGNGLLRPACASYRDKVADGKAYDNGMAELNNFLAPTLGYLCMQEDIMRWCCDFCGYTMGRSDLVRRAIAKKKGTEELLPQIRHDFIEYTSSHYGVSKEKCEQIIDPFLQVILDASAYAFSWNHSQPYSAIGYMCGYLRYYYPYEFITTALNVFADKEEKTSAIIAYANKNKIVISPPRFGVSRSEYAFDKENGVIAKGIASVKYMSATVAEELYQASKHCDNLCFLETLEYLRGHTCTDMRQLEILIKIGYFDMYGNVNSLLNLLSCFVGLDGKSSLDREMFAKIDGKIQPFVNGKKKDGGDAKRYKIVDRSGLFRCVEREEFSRNIPDASWREKAEYAKQYLGYVDMTTNRKEDRHMLYISEIREIKNRFKGGVWKYSVSTKSIGTGRSSWLSVTPYMMRTKPIMEGGILFAKAVHKDEKGYWNLLDYDVVE